MKKSCLLFTFFLLFLYSGHAQAIAPGWLSNQWNAEWITAPGTSEHGYEVLHFRKQWQMNDVQAPFVIHVSADNRYKLYVNDVLVSLGPARSEIFHWNFETVDIAPYLKKGNNILAAVVWNFGSYRQEAQQSYQTALIVQGNSSREEIVNTGNTWKCKIDSAYQPLRVVLPHAYYAAGPGEKVDNHFYPANWQQADFDDNAWQPAQPLMHGLPKGVFSYNAGWMLVPRTIPQVELTAQRLHEVRDADGLALPGSFPAATTSFTVEAHRHVKILLDQGFETNAYPVLMFGGGNHATIRLGYAEALFKKEGKRISYRKGNRNDITGKAFVGIFDEVLSDGRNEQSYSPLTWRTFRYLLLDINTADQPLTINDLYGIHTGYPFQFKATFRSSDSLLNKILEVGWRTARNCAVETYMDCPYYEQLQYVGDTRIQALISLFNSGDDRLMRNAITQLDYSRMAEGITQSRYPTNTPQQIPPFSLWWIGMVHDYWMYRDDPQFVKQFLPGERQVLSFFSRYQQADGSLKKPPYWEFTDWSEGNGWKDGVPPLGGDGCSSELDFQLLWAMQLASQLEDSLGLKPIGALYKEKAGQLMKTIKSKYWDNGRKLFADTKEKTSFSQHSNTLAILTGTVSGSAATELMNRILTDRNLTAATIYFKYYVNLALAKAGLGDSYLNQLGIWKQDLDSGLTTWAEMSDIDGSRSDCHAWGASPNIEFFRTVLGVDAAAPGFRQVLIEPHPGYLTHVSGTVPHPLGTIEVNCQQKGNEWEVMVALPAGTSGTLRFQGKTFSLKGGTRSNFTVPKEKIKQT